MKQQNMRSTLCFCDAYLNCYR